MDETANAELRKGKKCEFLKWKSLFPLSLTVVSILFPRSVDLFCSPDFPRNTGRVRGNAAVQLAEDPRPRPADSPARQQPKETEIKFDSFQRMI